MALESQSRRKLLSSIPSSVSWQTGAAFAGPDPDEGLDGPVSLSAKAESAPWWQPWRGTSAPAVPLCSFDRLPPAHLRGWAGPRIGLALPSFRCCSRAQHLHHCCEHGMPAPTRTSCTRLTTLVDLQWPHRAAARAFEVRLCPGHARAPSTCHRCHRRSTRRGW